MARYKLLVGGYSDIRGNSYRPGDIVEDSTNLVERFPNKFQEIREVPMEKVPAPKRKKAAPEKKQQVADVFEDAENEELEDLLSEIDNEDNVDDEISVPPGKEVTGQIPIAEELGYRVWKDGKYFHVVQKDATSKILNEPEEFNSTSKVVKFVQRHASRNS